MKKLETTFKQSPLTQKVLEALKDSLFHEAGIKYNEKETFELKSLIEHIEENKMDVRLVSRDY